MKTLSLRCLIFFTLLLVAPTLSAQTNGKASPDVKPFLVGETLSYEGKVSKIISGIAVADLTFTVADAPDQNTYLIKANAKSKGTLLKIARYSFLYQFSSNIDGKSFRIRKTEKQTAEKDRLRNSEAVFDYEEKRVTYVETDPREPMKPPRKIASGIEEQTYDLISGIYALRLLPLAVGKTFELTVSDSGLVYQVPVKVTGRVLQKSIFGKVWCFRVEPDVFGPGRMVESKGRMVIWITDDARRLPIRSQINTSIGKIDVKLKTAANLK